MQFRLSAILALSIGISAAFADDDFGLPDDVQKAEVPASVEDVADIPVNFAPIEATTTVTTDSSKKENPAAFKEHPIPEELNRPLRVGIFTGVKELYFKYQGETVHVTASKNKVKFEAGGIDIMTAIQLNSELFFTLGKISSDEGLMMKLLKYAKKLAATKEDETLLSKEDFMASIERGEEEHRQGKCVRLQPGETVSEMLRRSGL